MTEAGVSPQLLLILGILLAAAIYVTWRMRRVTRGVVYRGWLLLLLSLGYVGTFLFVGGVTTNLALAVEIVLAAGIGWLTAAYVAHSTEFYRAANGRWVFQTRVVVLAFWFGLFVSRVLLEFFLLGTVYVVDSLPIPGPLSTDSAVALLLIETVFSAATGVLFGSNAGIWIAYRNARRGATPVAAATAPGTPAVQEVLPPR